MKESKRIPDNIRLMDYDTARPLINSGDYLLCSGKGKISKAIRWATQSDYSHIARLWITEYGRIVVHESVEGQGVRIVSLSNYVRNHCGSGKGYDGRLFIYRHKRFNVLDRARIQRAFVFGLDHMGTKYDKWELARILKCLAFYRFGWGRKSWKKLKRDKIFICSEYAYEWDYAYDGNKPILNIQHDKRGCIMPHNFPQNPAIEAELEIKVVR